MKFLFCLLITICLLALVDPFVYMFYERWYRENSEAEKNYRFELLDTVFRHKYAAAISIAVGIICFIASIIVLKLYISPTL